MAHFIALGIVVGVMGTFYLVLLLISRHYDKPKP